MSIDTIHHPFELVRDGETVGHFSTLAGALRTWHDRHDRNANEAWHVKDGGSFVPVTEYRINILDARDGCVEVLGRRAAA